MAEPYTPTDDEVRDPVAAITAEGPVGALALVAYIGWRTDDLAPFHRSMEAHDARVRREAEIGLLNDMIDAAEHVGAAHVPVADLFIVRDRIEAEGGAS
jgi:hypothetical protein